MIIVTGIVSWSNLEVQSSALTFANCNINSEPLQLTHLITSLPYITTFKSKKVYRNWASRQIRKKSLKTIQTCDEQCFFYRKRKKNIGTKIKQSEKLSCGIIFMPLKFEDDMWKHNNYVCKILFFSWGTYALNYVLERLQNWSVNV